jgi:hypothetical protein
VGGGVGISSISVAGCIQHGRWLSVVRVHAALQLHCLQSCKWPYYLPIGLDGRPEALVGHLALWAWLLVGSADVLLLLLCARYSRCIHGCW